MVVDGDRVYSVSDVIKPRNSGGLNEDCAEEEDDEYDTNSSSRSSGVSKRMIQQFFTQEEGPDRDWLKYDNFDMLLEEDRQ